MNQPRFRTIALISLLFTCIFFREYLPPSRSVHIPYDLEYFHLPLLDAAFQSLRAGSFPQWDPANYCGSSIPANIQTALFYPPVWIMFASQFLSSHLSYQGLEDLVFAHVWIAFLLCYLWFRAQDCAALASIFGAGVYAYGGYMLLQLQHMGVIACFTWTPLAIWGIDEAARRRDWRPLWKVALASALAFLGGYPPAWFVFAVCASIYVLFTHMPWKLRAAALGAIAFSLLVAGVQLIPSAQAASDMVRENRYGAGIREPDFFLSYLIPNFSNFSPNVDPHTNPGREYLYLGAPAVLGILWLFRSGVRRQQWAPLAVAIASLVLITNAFDVVGSNIARIPVLAHVCRDWYFLAGLSLAASALTATGLDRLLRLRAPARPKLVYFATALLLVWSAWLLTRTELASGWRGAVEPAVILVLFSIAMFAYPNAPRRAGIALATAMLLTVGIDYQVFGVHRRFNAGPAPVSNTFASGRFPEVDPSVLMKLRRNREFRTAIDTTTGPFPQLFRHLGLTTPQGFDPFIPNSYLLTLRDKAIARTNWVFDFDPANVAGLRALGVRYFVSAEQGAAFPKLQGNPAFRRVDSGELFFRVFELIDATPAYRFEAGTVDQQSWSPAHRAFTVASAGGGRFTLIEQRVPGWRAAIDGATVAIEPYDLAFQAVDVPPGQHRIEFNFASPGLLPSAVVSLASLGLLLKIAFDDTRSRRSKIQAV